MANYIQNIEIKNLWGRYDLKWDNLHPDVNILVGINGSGKSSVLKFVDAVLSKDKKAIAKTAVNEVKIVCTATSVSYQDGTFVQEGPAELTPEPHLFIHTFDVPVYNKKELRQDESPLMLELRQLILLTGTNSFNDYRLRALSEGKADEVNLRIKKFFAIIDELFVNTGKTVGIDFSNNIIFKADKDEVVTLEKLSSGEKQLLLILFKVFLMDEKPYILLMDEPEISMHVAWQSRLITVIRELNPQCQLLVATHSPTIFGQGWGDKVTFMEQLFH